MTQNNLTDIDLNKAIEHMNKELLVVLCEEILKEFAKESITSVDAVEAIHRTLKGLK